MNVELLNAFNNGAKLQKMQYEYNKVNLMRLSQAQQQARSAQNYNATQQGHNHPYSSQMPHLFNP